MASTRVARFLVRPLTSPLLSQSRLPCVHASMPSSRRLASTDTTPAVTDTDSNGSANPLTAAAQKVARVLKDGETDDPGMNNNYPNPPPQKRHLRDPYGDWWDKQERRNYNEPVHEDDDILTMLSPHEYTHFSAGRAFRLFAAFWGTVALGAGIVKYTDVWPDVPSAPRTFEGGLEEELGGRGAVRARNESEGEAW